LHFEAVPYHQPQNKGGYSNFRDIFSKLIFFGKDLCFDQGSVYKLISLKDISN